MVGSGCLSSIDDSFWYNVSMKLHLVWLISLEANGINSARHACFVNVMACSCLASWDTYLTSHTWPSERFSSNHVLWGEEHSIQIHAPLKWCRLTSAIYNTLQLSLNIWCCADSWPLLGQHHHIVLNRRSCSNKRSPALHDNSHPNFDGIDLKNKWNGWQMAQKHLWNVHLGSLVPLWCLPTCRER